MTIDPWVSNESRKIWKSFAYFVLTWCWIEDKQNKCAIRFALWPEQLRVLPRIVRAMRLIVLKARQLGLTWIVAAYVLWLAWTRALQLIVVISVNEELSIEFLDRVYFMLDRLPENLRPKVKTRTKQTLEIQHFNGLVSTIKSLPTTEMGAQSKTPTLLVLDETSRNRLVSEIYAASLPGIDAAGGRVIVISNSIKDAPGWPWTRGIYVDSMKGENCFERMFMDWKARPDRPENFRELKLLDGMTEEDFVQHYPESEEEAISSMGGSYFGDALGRHKETRKGEVGTIKNHDEFWTFEPDPRGILEIWQRPYQEEPDYDGRPWLYRYAMGADVSEGLGDTYSTAYVYDRLTDEICARMRSNRVDADRWGEMCNDLASYYDRALICPERTGAGQTTVKRLRALRANLYLRVKAEKTGKQQVTKVFGWEETRNSKQELAGDLRTYLKRTEAIVPDAILLDECSTFIKREDGGLGHEEGKYDDCVIGAGLMLQADAFIGRAPEKVPQVPDMRRPPKDASETAALERREIEKAAQEAYELDVLAMEGVLEDMQEWGRDEFQEG